MSKKSYRSKFRWWHLLLVPIIILPLKLCLTAVATAKVVVERLCGLFHLRNDTVLMSAKKQLSIRGARKKFIVSYLHTERSKSENAWILFHSACSVFPPE